MAKIQNNFLKGKMNKDLDERIVPKGEYREAQNIMITQSEGSDVGAIENVLGNALAKGLTNIVNVNPFPSTSRQESLETIGYYNDVLNSKVYWFVSNFSGVDNDNVFEINRAKDYHTCAILLADLGNASSTIQVLAQGNFLNFSKRHLITGVNLIDDLLFWTDNYNQPRKINVTTAFTDNNYYNTEEKISVAKFTPYLAPILVDSNNAGHDVTLKNDGNVKSEYLKENFVRFSYRYKYDDGEYSTMAPFTQIIFSPLNNARIPYASNTEYNSESIEREGTVDLMQNHYNKAVVRIPLPCSENLTSAIVNSSDETVWNNDLKISKIEILIKESEEAAVKVVDSIEIDNSFESASAASASLDTGVEYYTVKPNDTTEFFRYVYRYIYKSEEPYSVLPENQTTRVYDHVPLRAKAQEISGNRIIYGNYTENPPLPYDQTGKKGINYVINSINKSDAEFGFDWGKKQHLYNAYKYHSLKQRRTYQVGVVLADKFGRQSSVILSSNITDDKTDTHTIENQSTSFSDTFENPTTFTTGYSWSAFREVIGKSLSVEFIDNRIVPAEQVYNGDITSEDYNPYGWYSWRLVVKQKEQEYYNVYSTHPADSWNNVNDSEDVSLNGRSWLSLHGDNINKVPRIASDTDANKEGVSSSEIRLFPKVIKSATSDVQNTSVAGANIDPVEVISIGTAREQGLTKEDGGIYGFVSASKKNPSVAELPNLAPAGTTNGNRVLLHTKSTVYLASGGTLDSVTLKGNNPFIKVGQYVSSNNGSFADPIVVTIDEQGGEPLTNKKTLRIQENHTSGGSEVNENEQMIKVGDYVDHGFSSINTTNANGEVFRPTIIKRERLLKTNGNPGKTILSLDQAITTADGNGHLGERLIFREFTKVKSINNKKIGDTIYQEIQLTNKVTVASDDIFTFRNVDNSPVAVITGLSVFETEPFKSKLDIFYETSTSGLVSDLNLQANVSSSEPTNLSIDSSNFNEQNSNNNNSTVGSLTAEGSVTNIFTFSISSIDTTNLEFNSSSNSFLINGNDLDLNGQGFVWHPTEPDRNQFNISINISENGGTTATEILPITLENSPCLIQANLPQELMEATIPWQSGEGYTIFTCDVSNGSGNPNFESEYLQVHLSFPSRTATLPSGGLDVYDQTGPSNTFTTAVIDTSYFPLTWQGGEASGFNNFGMFTAEFDGTLLKIKTTSYFYANQFFNGEHVTNFIQDDGSEGLSSDDRTIRVTISDGDTDNSNWAYVDVELKIGQARTGVRFKSGDCDLDYESNVNQSITGFAETGNGGEVITNGFGQNVLSNGNILYDSAYSNANFIAQGPYKILESVDDDQAPGVDTMYKQYATFSVNESGVVQGYSQCQLES